MLPVQITIRDLTATTALEKLIYRRTNKLSQYFQYVSDCHVVVDYCQKHKHQGKLYNVKIEANVPRKRLVTCKQHQDVYVALRNAFNAIERQIEDYARKRHGRVKTHSPVLHGHVTRVMSNQGYGFIEDLDGNEYYFSMTNVCHPSFSKLMQGDSVAYMPKLLKGSDGRKAHRVVKNHHHLTA